MLTGNTERFAIEAHPEEFSNGWVLGRFRFWIRAQPVGNWDDLADLAGCVRWLRDFATNLPNRFDARLEGLSGSDVFALLYDPVFGSHAIADPDRQPIPRAYVRFHISHIGMSSFDGFDILLVSTASGEERCLWRSAGDLRVAEVLLHHGEMEAVASQFCDEFERTYLSSSPSGEPFKT